MAVPSANRLRVVIVDDDPDAVTTLMTLLLHEGHMPFALFRAKNVVRTVQDTDPDVVLLDIGLPDGSGYAIAEEIRRACGPARPMVIAITGTYREPLHDRLSRLAGCDHFLTKPFGFDQLLRLFAPLALPHAARPG